jgi:hypothetical protein
MTPGKLIAWIFLIAAFVAAAAETAAHAIQGTVGLMSAHELLYTLAPGKYIIAQGWIEDHLGRALWDPALRTVLIMPAWALFLVPGIALIWLFRVRPDPFERHGEDAPHSTYEDVVAAAEEANGEARDDTPSKYAGYALYDPTDLPAEDEGGDGWVVDADDADLAEEPPHGSAERRPSKRASKSG